LQANAIAQNRVQTAQSFRRIATREQGLNVLNRFRVELAGNTIRIHDSDGSTYTGELRASARGAGGAAVAGHAVAKDALKAKSRPEPVASKKAAVEEESGVPARYEFRVTGTNSIINKIVVFEGEIVSVEQGAGLVDRSRAAQNQAAGYASNSQQNSLVPPAGSVRVRVAGKVMIGGVEKGEIEAISTETSPGQAPGGGK